MNQLVDIPATPSAALRKLREGLCECGLFVFSAPCKGLCFAIGALQVAFTFAGVRLLRIFPRGSRREAVAIGLLVNLLFDAIQSLFNG